MTSNVSDRGSRAGSVEELRSASPSQDDGRGSPASGSGPETSSVLSITPPPSIPGHDETQQPSEPRPHSSSSTNSFFSSSSRINTPVHKRLSSLNTTLTSAIVPKRISRRDSDVNMLQRSGSQNVDQLVRPLPPVPTIEVPEPTPSPPSASHSAESSSTSVYSPPRHVYMNTPPSSTSCASPSDIVNSNERINPRSVTEEYNLPVCLMNQDASTVESSSTKKSSPGEKAVAYNYFANPFSWDTMDGKEEPDDYLHDPEMPIPVEKGSFRYYVVSRGFANLGVLILLCTALVMLFAGYPIIAVYKQRAEGKKGGFNLGGTNATGQVANFPGIRTGLIDPDTPRDAYEINSLNGDKKMELVFSDEFNTEGRSFYPGDDPYWEAVDLHYWGTNNYEWYSPEAVTTRGGALEITLAEVPTNNLNFRGGFLSTWNKFCFTGGYLVASIQLPGDPNVPGLWPAFWTMGNLGRAGYGASVEGNWPYSYDTCDVGTLMNQTDANGLPLSSAEGGDVMWNRKFNSKSISFLPGQRLSACTCPGEDHPGPKLSDGTWKGRAAPEIDVFEAQVDRRLGMTVSQSMQAAPFNYLYDVTNSTGPAYEFYLPDTELNMYNGQNTQQALSAVSVASQQAMQLGGDGSFAEYGFEYATGKEDGYIEWVSDGRPSWRLNKAALDADPVAQIGPRVIPEEPMYVILNLGISQNFGSPDWNRLRFPAKMRVDWVRVYQPEGETNVGCDPKDFPTADYIERHPEAYYNANLTTWGGTRDTGGYGANWPKNRLYPQGCDAPPSNLPGSPVQPYPKASPIPSSQIAIGQ